MAILSPAQIASLAKSRGFSGNNLVIAVAVCLAESGGNTLAHNGGSIIDREDSYGLWQINILAHPQFSPSLLLSSPFYNAGVAYAISGGSNWNAWGSYTSGAYKKFLPQAQAAVNGAPPPITQGSGSGSTPPPQGKPWYTFSRVDNLGIPDSFGGFPKPDSNIQVPDGYPITALLPGTVSGTNTSDAWGASVTIALDTPLNALATHTAYLHLRCDLQVRTGQHVAAGQLIAYNGGGQACGSQKVPLGFALYNGNVYGHDGWGFMTKANLAGGPLDPVPLLNLAAQGKLSIPNLNLGGLSFGGFSLGTFGFGEVTPTYTHLTAMVHETLIDTPGFYGIALALDEAEQFPGWVDLTQQQPDQLTPDIAGFIRSIGATVSDNFVPFAIRSGLVVLGMALLIALIARAAQPQIEGVMNSQLSQQNTLESAALVEALA